METVELTRDCEVTVIPGGDRMTLSAGTPVDITHSLGGAYTVRAGGRLYPSALVRRFSFLPSGPVLKMSMRSS